LRVRAIVLFFALLAAASPARAQPKIALYTFGPGDSIPERFGHSAFRVTEGDTDVVYNLGHPGRTAKGVDFFIELVQGDTEFVGTVGEAEAEIARYRDKDRTVRHQVLHLPPERARWLADWLDTEVGGGRFSYEYDYLRVNCTTEIRDLLDEATEGALRRAADAHPDGPTYRELTMEGFRGHFPTLLGADILSGPVQDRPITRWQKLFLPEPLHDVVAEVPGLAPESVTTYTRRGPPPQQGPRDLGRYAVFGLSTILFLLLVASRRWSQLTRAAGIVLLHTAPMIAFTGLGAWFLMATSSLADLTWNENAVAMWPTDILLVAPAIAWIRKREPARLRLLRGYLAAHLVAIALLIGAKLAGLADQDNVAFLAATLLVLVGVLIRAGGATQKRVAK
jgi:hypothetical protein